MPGKRVQFDDETWQALDVLARSVQRLTQKARSSCGPQERVAPEPRRKCGRAFRIRYEKAGRGRTPKDEGSMNVANLGTVNAGGKR
jgi:hypothetical protein